MQPRHHLLLTCAGALVALGCAGNAPPGAAPRASTSGGVTLSSPRPARNGALRVLVYHDMEGLAGQDD